MDRTGGDSKGSEQQSGSFQDIGTASFTCQDLNAESERYERELTASQMAMPMRDGSASLLGSIQQYPQHIPFDFSHDLPAVISHPPQQRRTASANNLDSLSSPEQSMSPTIFDPPHRSIFTSGPPTASLSSSTAQALMSAASPSGSSLPLAALTNANASRKGAPRSIELPSQFSSLLSPTRQSLTVPEKDVDDPSDVTTAYGPDMVEASSTLSKLFAVSASASPMPTTGGISHLRSFSGSTPVIESTTTLTGHLLHRGFMGEYYFPYKDVSGVRHALNLVLIF